MTVEQTGPFTSIDGRFFRAVDPRYREQSLDGSRVAGRYSRADEPTLYLSSSRDGVAAAMLAHSDQRSPERDVLELVVEAERIVDLRDDAALAALGIDRADAVVPWQDIVAAGGMPPSWGVRDRLIAAGALGLIDPSRQRPGLWHLVLFRWNVPGAPTVWRD